MKKQNSHKEVTVSVLPKCDLCAQEGRLIDARYDAKTNMGPWANMCQRHYNTYGIGLGLGLGQKLVLKK